MFEKRKNWMGSRMCKNSMGEPLHGWTMEVTKSHRTHVGLHKRCTELYHRGRVLNQVATTHLEAQRRLRGSWHVMPRKRHQMDQAYSVSNVSDYVLCLLMLIYTLLTINLWYMNTVKPLSIVPG
jgi:hypothetical protein